MSTITRTPVAFYLRADGALRPIYSLSMARYVQSAMPEIFGGWYVP